MRFLRASVAFVLLLCTPVICPAQTVKLPVEVKIAPGRLAAVTIDWTGTDLKWAVPGDLDIFREYDIDPLKVRLRLIGYVAGKYELKAIACSKDGKLSDFATCVIIVGDPVPPPPPPPPPPPEDDFSRDLKTAWTSETAPDRRERLLLLASLFRTSSEQVKTSDKTTVYEFYMALQTARKNLIAESLPLLRKTITTELDRVLPRDTSAPLDTAAKDLCSKTFAKVAANLENLK